MTNTTPLITLAGIGRLDLLVHLYDEVWAPRVVVNEYQAKVRPDEPDLTRLSWLRIVDDVPIDPTLPLLDAGEAAAISLAQTLKARLILLDERKARRIAAHMGLPVAGTLAVLLRAKQHGLITALRPYTLQMQNQGRRLHPDLIARLLEEAGNNHGYLFGGWEDWPLRLIKRISNLSTCLFIAPMVHFLMDN